MEFFEKYSWAQMVLKAKALLGKTSLAVGVDWGSRVMTAVALRADHKGLTLQDFSMYPLGEKNRQQELSDEADIESIPKNIPTHAHTIGISVAGASVLVKAITLPVMTEKDLRDHLALELDRYISLDTQEVFWDVYYQPTSPKFSVDQQEHFLVIAKKMYVEQQVKMFREKGVPVHFVDVGIFALVNLVVHNYGKEGTWLLAHIEATGIVMAKIRNGEPVFIRQETYGAEWYGDLLDEVLPLEGPIKTEKELGISATLLLEQFSRETSKKLSEAMESSSGHLAEDDIDRGILLSGGYAVVPGMRESLEHSLGRAVHLVDPFQAITVAESTQNDLVFKRSAPLMGVAVGVALRGACLHD